MEQTYQYLLSLELKHEYFKDGQFKSIQVSYDEQTQRLIKNLGIILKPYPGGMHILASDTELLNDTTLSTPIRLFLTCNDPYYMNYSELPDYRPSDTVLYFNNLDSIQHSESTALRLHQKDYVGQNDVAQLSFGKLIVSSFDETKAYHFEDVFGNDISNHIRPSQNKSEVFLISNLPQGMIRVLADGQETEQVYYYPASVWEKPLGVAELYLPTLFEQYAENEKQTYTLNFDTRSTIWKYFLINPVYKNFEDLSIIDTNKEQVFKSLGNESIQGSEALVFESRKPIAFSEFSIENFQLVDKFDTVLKQGNPIVIKALPRASPEQLFYGSDKKIMYSHIYI